MRQAVAPDPHVLISCNVVVDLLLRNAQKIDVAGEREDETEPWTRGNSNASKGIVESRSSLGV